MSGRTQAGTASLPSCPAHDQPLPNPPSLLRWDRISKIESDHLTSLDGTHPNKREAENGAGKPPGPPTAAWIVPSTRAWRFASAWWAGRVGRSAGGIAATRGARWGRAGPGRPKSIAIWWPAREARGKSLLCGCAALGRNGESRLWDLRLTPQQILELLAQFFLQPITPARPEASKPMRRFWLGSFFYAGGGTMGPRDNVTKACKSATKHSPARLSLAEQFSRVMGKKQMVNMVSHVYSASGRGLPPVSAGKFELRRRHRLWQQ